MPLSVLVCEDEKIAHTWLKRVVNAWGHDTYSAYTGQEAIQQAADHKPDVILLDMLYPDMGGEEVLKAIHGNADLENTKVVLVSATVPEELAPLIEAYNVASILQKPVKTDELKELLEEFEQSSKGSSNDAEKPLFMVIDRSGVQQKVVERMLADLGCESLLVDTPEAATSLLRNVEATGILLDVTEDAREITTILQQISESSPKPLPIIVLSTVIDQKIVQKLFKFGVTDILVKPIMTSRLRQSVRKVLNKNTPQSTVHQEAEASTKTILIVEDFTITANLMERLLKGTSYRTITARSGTIAYDIIHRHPPSLMLLDLNMPGMSGMELAGKLLEEKIDVPFAVITAERDEQRLKLLRQLGALKIFRKPLNGKELLSFVKGLERGETEVDSDVCNYQVLLAMGDETTAGFIEEALKQADLTFRTVTDGYLASTELSSNPPIAVIDMALSGIEGKEILTRVKSSEQATQTRILSLDAKMDDARKAELKKLGSDAVLGKPFKVKQLVAQVWELLATVKQSVDVSEFADAFAEELDSLPNPDSPSYLEQAKRLGHNLAGTAGLISNKELHDSGVSLERAAKANDLDKCKSEIATISKIIDGFRGAGKSEDTATQESDEAPPVDEDQATTEDDK